MDSSSPTADLSNPSTSTGSCPYTEDYFLRGKEAGVSLYEDYRWLPHLTHPMCEVIASHLGVQAGETVLDFGCARGYMVRALREQGYHAWGVDASPWAIQNCDENVREWVEEGCTPNGMYDWAIAKDVLEHVEPEALPMLLQELFDCCNKGFFAVVPLSAYLDGPYVVPDYEKDVTHLVRMSLGGWADLFREASFPHFMITAQYRIQGIKDNYAAWREGNGFLTCKRVARRKL